MDTNMPEFGAIEMSIGEIYCDKEIEILRKLQDAVASKNLVRVVLGTPMLKEPHSNLDIADDYFMALIFGEMIAPFCTEIDWEEVPGAYGTEAIAFNLIPCDTAGLAQKLAWYSQSLRQFLDPDDDSWTSEYADGPSFEDLRGFGDDMEANVRRFDDLAESYVRNLEVGLTEQYDGKELQVVYDELRVAYRRWWDPSLEKKPLDIDISRLSQGMTQDQVVEEFGGQPSYMQSAPIAKSHVQVLDYRSEDAGENVCRLWFLNDSLVTWQTGKIANSEVSFHSNNVPEFITELRERGKA